ncbi:hypothetical protein [Nocardioides convexus]|uniref:hypothetical protein n=1 Tax=Nocardioides convexus TaxID=2712224 RepID=UPI0024184972|nr:hypothetical protein [Nocardioides convexus]
MIFASHRSEDSFLWPRLVRGVDADPDHAGDRERPQRLLPPGQARGGRPSGSRSGARHPSRPGRRG